MLALSRLPGVGRKSAQRMVFHLLRKDPQAALSIGDILPRLVTEVGFCQFCRDFTEQPICQLCQQRQYRAQLCIVESPMDLLAIEQSGAYSGRYFVLHGHLSPIDGLGPTELGIPILEELLNEGQISELIIALSGSIDNEATAQYLQAKFDSLPLDITRIAQGIPLGGELEYTDSATLAQALQRRSQLQSQ